MTSVHCRQVAGGPPEPGSNIKDVFAPRETQAFGQLLCRRETAHVELVEQSQLGPIDRSRSKSGLKQGIFYSARHIFDCVVFFD
jgi:hypothetical protein